MRVGARVGVRVRVRVRVRARVRVRVRARGLGLGGLGGRVREMKICLTEPTAGNGAGAHPLDVVGVAQHL